MSVRFAFLTYIFFMAIKRWREKRIKLTIYEYNFFFSDQERDIRQHGRAEFTKINVSLDIEMEAKKIWVNNRVERSGKIDWKTFSKQNYVFGGPFSNTWYTIIRIFSWLTQNLVIQYNKLRTS